MPQTPLRMKSPLRRPLAPPRPRHAFLALLALAFLAAYVLACRPAFSPDGSKILLSSVGEAEHSCDLLVFDRKSSQWSRLLTVGQAQGDTAIISANWSARGTQIVAAWTSDNDQLQVAVLPAGRAGSTRIFTIASVEDPLLSLIGPPVLFRHYAIVGGHDLAILNLYTGEVTRQAVVSHPATNAPAPSIQLLNQGAGVYYLANIGTNLSAGRVDLTDPTHPRLLPLLEAPLGRKTGRDEGVGMIAFSRVGARFAWVQGDVDDQRLEIYRDSKLEHSIQFGAIKIGTILGNLVWSADGKTLYATGFKPLTPGPIAKALHAGHEALHKVGIPTKESPPLDMEVVLCEIPLGSSRWRETPLYRISKVRNEAFLFCHQIALSPDGEVIASSTGITDDPQVERALYLVDLHREHRSVKKWRMPKASQWARPGESGE